ncbi:MAG: GNAT family N-acetyltransferase [Burkholderiaceae bacterium]|nr:GNAT family N-acetyltransferase [Burkholderiaceae bacterium]
MTPSDCPAVRGAAIRRGRRRTHPQRVLAQRARCQRRKHGGEVGLWRAGRRPALSLLALHQGQVIGVVNLVDNDDKQHRKWHPWLAGMVVAETWRGQGGGSALVHAILLRARELRYSRVYFGTDWPGFYARLGAVHHEQPPADFWFMRFDL